MSLIPPYPVRSKTDRLISQSTGDRIRRITAERGYQTEQECAKLGFPAIEFRRLRGNRYCGSFIGEVISWGRRGCGAA